jgi:uncharacterized membrane protein HdeD (DUF308 family)
MKDFFKRMLSEDNGNPSTNRWGLFNAIFMIWALVIGILAVVYFNRPETLIYAIISAIVCIGGIFLTAKVTQKRFEQGQQKEETEITK